MPIREYEMPENEAEKYNCTIKLVSSQHEIKTKSGESLFDAMVAVAREDGEDVPDYEGDGEFEMCGDGLLEVREGRLEVSYKECGEGMESVTTAVSFDLSDRGIITVERKGEIGHAFVIEQGVRQFSVYSTPFGPIEMCIYGRKVENEMNENGGYIVLDYSVELRGMTAQRTKMKMEVKKI